MATKKIAAILRKRNTEKYAQIIKRAELNGYHDFKFDKVDSHPEYGNCICPKMQLVDDLGAFPELEDIRTDVINGKYDESPDEEDTLNMRMYLMQEGVPEHLYNVLGFNKPTEAEKQIVNVIVKNN